MLKIIQNLIDWPSRLDAPKNLIFVNTSNLGPLGKCLNLTKIFYTMVYTPIVLLFFFCSPVAVFRAVTLIVISTLQSVFTTWPSSYVFNKMSEVHPPNTHGDTTSTITLVLFVVWIATTLFHRVPYGIFRNSPISWGQPMFGVPTTTRGCTSATQAKAISSNLFDDATNAFTGYVPTTITTITWQTNDGESPYSFFQENFGPFHNRSITCGFGPVYEL